MPNNSAATVRDDSPRKRIPVSSWLRDTLWSVVGREFVSPDEFDLHFDCVEVMVALACQSVRAAQDKSDFSG